MEVVFEVDIQNLMTPMYMKNAWFPKGINTNIGYIRWVNDICMEMVIKIVYSAVTHTPVSDNGGSRPRNDWTPRSQILQPITNSSHPQNDLISLIQHQGMLQKVLTLPKKDMEEQQKVPMEKQEIIYLRKG